MRKLLILSVAAVLLLFGVGGTHVARAGLNNSSVQHQVTGTVSVPAGPSVVCAADSGGSGVDDNGTPGVVGSDGDDNGTPGVAGSTGSDGDDNGTPGVAGSTSEDTNGDVQTNDDGEIQDTQCGPNEPDGQNNDIHEANDSTVKDL